jgi:ParB-like chromosome segregation protein Spo0J
MAIENIIEVEVEKLIKAKWNYKKDDKKKMSNLINSIKMHNQIELLLVRELKEGFEVVNGNHRVDALIELKIEKALCYNLGKIPEKQAKLIAVQTNEIRFDSDPGKLGIILDELMFNKFDLDELIPVDILKLISDHDIDTDYKVEKLKPYNKTHILLSFSPEILVKVMEQLQPIIEMEGIEFEQSAN